MAEQDDGNRDLHPVTLVGCAEGDNAGCEIVRRAVAMVAADTHEAAVATAEQCPRGRKTFVVAVDGCSSCQASGALRRCGVRAGAVVSAPAVLAAAGLVRPGVDVRLRLDELAEVVAAAIRESLKGALDEARERRRYREEMTPVMARFKGIWSKVQALPSPNGAAPPEERPRVELLAKRSRNLFGKFDEIVPPSAWAEPHDLFQDALLCIAYACEGWVSGDAERWEQNLEKARVQVKPLIQRVS